MPTSNPMLRILQPHIEATLAWMRETGTEPNDVYSITWTNDTVTVEFFERNGAGQKFKGPCGDPVTERVELPVEVVPHP